MGDSGAESNRGAKTLPFMGVIAYNEISVFIPKTGPMPQVMSQQAVKAIILNDENEFILLQRRLAGKAADWDLPGGLVEPDEQPTKALLREIKEELGIKIKIITASNTWHFFRPLDKKTVTVQNYICQFKGGKIKLSREHADYIWITPAQLPNFAVKDPSFHQAIAAEFKYQPQ